MDKIKRLLSLDDLYEFYAKGNKDVRFSANDTDSNIVVHITEPFVFKKQFDNDLNLKTYLRFCHTKDNVNKSFISKNSMKDAIPTAYNMPILGYIYKNKDDEYVFAGHEFYEDENGDTVYEEVPVGVIPESADLKLVYDKKEDKDYLEGYGLIWKTYSKAAEILERVENLSVSVELVVEELSYSAKEKMLQIEKFKFSGVTILQEDRETGEEIKPGMRNASISLTDFSAENNSVFTEELINELKKFNKNFETLNENKQGGQEMNLFEELLAKYGVTEEDVEFDYSEMSEEELEKAFAEAFETEDENVESEESEEKPKEDGEEFSESEGEEAAEEGSEEEGSEPKVEEEFEETSDEDNADASEENGKTYSITLPNGDVKTFSLSLGDIENALYCLVNDTYSELDNDIYGVQIYPDDKQVVMCGFFSNSCYRQSYKRKKDSFSLEGERVRVHSIFVSEDEQKMLDDMKANYSVIESKLANYEAEPEKVEILNSDEYAGIKATEEYAEISKRENYFELSKEDLTKKLDEITLSYAKQNKLNFSANADEVVTKKSINIVPIMGDSTNVSRGRYGGIFHKETK